MQSGEATKKQFLRAKQVMPLGVTSNFRYWGENATLVVKNGKGAYIWDMDDKRYIDYRLGFGPVILGHANEAVNNKVKTAIDSGNIFAMTNLYEIELAEKIKKLTGVDLVRYANSGTEATMHAIRIARAYTGRNTVLKFEGMYHGFQDYTLWNCMPPLSGLGYRKSPVLIAHGSGIPNIISNLVISIPFNNIDILEQKIKAKWGEIACIIVEPIMGNCASIMPKGKYLQAIRKLCDEYGIVMIFDEVKTGFRIAKGGGQEFFNINADLVTWAKSLGNGFPIAAIGGKKSIMGEIGPSKIPHGGTYSGNVAATSAACATLEEIEKGALDQVNHHGNIIMKGFKRILREKGIPSVIQGPPSMFSILFTESEQISEYRDFSLVNHEYYNRLARKLIEKGVMPDMDPREPWFVSSAHSDSDAENVLNIFKEVIDEVF